MSAKAPDTNNTNILPRKFCVQNSIIERREKLKNRHEPSP